jgi:hypothetical protein
LARWRLRVFAASMMGSSREWVAQKYQALKCFAAHFGYT